jgi:hypothetical protein
VVLAVAAVDGFEPVDPQVFEQRALEGRDPLAAVDRSAASAGDVMLGVRLEPSTIACRSPCSSALK